MNQGAINAVGATDVSPMHARVVAAVLVMNGPNECDVVYPFRHCGEQLGDVDAGHIRSDRGERSSDFGGGVGFWIPQVDVTGGASVEDEDNGFCFSRGRIARRRRG